jgi:hypothetical protein
MERAEVEETLKTRLFEQLAAWRDDLINLSRVNRLLYFKHTKSASLEIIQRGSTAILERLNAAAPHNQWSFFMPADPDEEERDPSAAELVIADKDAGQINSALRLLERKSNQFSSTKASGSSTWDSVSSNGSIPLTIPLSTARSCLSQSSSPARQ